MADLPVVAVPGGGYGDVVAQLDAQRAVPMGAPLPGGFGDPLRGTDRPDEPVTSGAALGAGPGPEVMPGGGRMDGLVLASLYGLYRRFPAESLRELIEDVEDGAF